MTTPLHPDQIYRLILDYQALKEAFQDRIDELNSPLTEIDAAGGMTRGNMQKCLSDSDAKWARDFGWESLGKALKGTGLVLALITDDERFAPIREQMATRKMVPRRETLSAGSMRLLKGKITRKTSNKMQLLRNQKLSPQQRRRIAKLAARMRWAATRRERQQSGGKERC